MGCDRRRGGGGRRGRGVDEGFGPHLSKGGHAFAVETARKLRQRTGGVRDRWQRDR